MVRRLSLLVLPLTALMACGDKDDDDDDDDDTGSIGTDETVDADADGYTSAEGDCDDDDDAINPGATEVCDGVDNDCDDTIDDDDDDVDLTTGSVYYIDADGDGYGLAGTEIEACVAPSATADNDTDCDDEAVDINPGATEICDADDTDEDCSGDADDADSGVSADSQERYYADSDADGYGDQDDAGTLSCDPASGVVLDNTDCDDDAVGVNPDAVEICDEDDTDEDCSGLADDADAGVDATSQTLWYADIDTDGYGDEDDAGTLYCDAPSGVVADNTDCDDDAIAVNPAASEVCDTDDTDEDCSGLADDDDAGVDTTTRTTWYPDVDGDGYGDQDGAGVLFCDAPSGTVSDQTDCDDDAIGVNPGASEICDAVDNDCDTATGQDGMVTFITSAGVSSDVSSTFSGGTSGSPNTVSVTAAGEYAFCDGTYYANITTSVDVALYAQDGAAVLDGGDTDHILRIETDGISVEIDDLTLENGVADSLTALGYTAGGAIACDSNATVTVTSSTLDTNGADVGGAIATTDCTVELDDVLLTDNYSNVAGGGIFIYGAGSVTATDSTMTGGDAVYGGAFYVYDSGTLDLVDSVVEGNDAEYGGAGFIYDVAGTIGLSCTGSPGATAGFTDNVSTLGTGAVAIENGSGAYNLTFTDCDFGRIPDGDDNDGGGLFHAGSDWVYGVGNDATFSCNASDCGSQADYALGNDERSYSGDERIRGAIFLGTGEGTIDDLGLQLDPDSSCVLDHYVLSNSAVQSTDWTVEWSSTGNTVGAGGDDFYGATGAGVGVHAGTYYAVVSAWICSTSGHEVGYAINAASASSVTDLDFATNAGTVETNGYTTTLSGTGNTFTVYAAEAQYEGSITGTEL
jgi:hypothetical protein